VLPTADVTETLERAEQSAGRDLAERDDDRRPDNCELQVEVRGARRDFWGERRTVHCRGHGVGWPAHDRVRDVHTAAVEPDRGEQAAERLACSSDERATLGVLVLARRLTEQDESGGRRTLAEHDVTTRWSIQGTAGASLGELREEPEPALAAIPSVHAPPLVRVNCSRR
jgi:hypothetical protein